ncbi:hypothetical protein [Candidatus Nitrosocosmicus sp. FF01]|uniref:hypothetical protein n=1 Tax=Candidatus Nitrosocosmicus sp. FF01 TaxID=3397670 RepID=UPI0039E8626F
MVKKIGVIFAVLLVVLLLSNTNYNANNQVFAQNTSGLTDSNVTQTPTPIQSPSTNITKLAGGIKINSPDKGDLVPLNSNKSLVIYGVSKDTASTDCDVTIIVNNVKPYQNVQPTGIQGNNDYSTWQYTLSSNYTSINEGNNKITSKIYCAAAANGNGTGGSNVTLSPQPSQAYYSVNITASNFTQAQLTNYELMLESASNSTNGNSTLASNAIQPVAQIQQFNQDTGSGPVCCKTTSALTTQSSDSGTGSGSSSNNDDDDDDNSSSSNNDDDDDDNSSSSNNDDDDDDNSSSSNNDDDDDDNSSSSNNDDDDDDNSSSSNNDDDDDDNSSSSNNDDDDDDNSSSNRNNDDDDSFDFSSGMNDFDFGFNFDTDSSDSDSSWSDDSGDNSAVDSILDNVEDTMKSAGLDFSFS